MGVEKGGLDRLGVLVGGVESSVGLFLESSLVNDRRVSSASTAPIIAFC